LFAGALGSSPTPTVGVSRGEYATVIDIDHERNAVTVGRQRDGVQITYNPKRLSGVQLYEREERQFAVGERIQFTNPWKEKGIGNRDIGTITRLDEEGLRSLRDHGSALMSPGWI
jgi:hypothetical protein